MKKTVLAIVLILALVISAATIIFCLEAKSINPFEASINKNETSPTTSTPIPVPPQATSTPTPSPTPTSTPTASPTSTPNTPVNTTVNQSGDGYYLPLPNNGSASRIFVVSSSLTSGVYPYDTRYAMGPSDNGLPVVEKGEPCIIITLTIRSDYSAQNLPPQNPNNSSSVQVKLTAKIFNGTNQINATDLSKVGLPAGAGTYTFLNSGESATLSIYLAPTSQMDITSFQIIPTYIGSLAEP